MNKIKQIFVKVVCFFMAFAIAFSIVPTEMQASLDTRYHFYGPVVDRDAQIIVYKGAENLYAGNFIGCRLYYAPGDDLGYLTFLDDVRYSSSKPSVASVNGATGKIKAKKAGTTTIIIKFGIYTYSFELKVLTKKSFFKEMEKRDKESGYVVRDFKSLAATADKEAKAFLKKTGNFPTITLSNRYRLLTAYNTYKWESGYASYRRVAGYNIWDYYYYSPTAQHASLIYDKIENYAYALNPFNTYSEAHFSIQSISGKKSTITVKLTKKVTEDMIYGANYEFSWNSEVKKSKTYTFPIVVKDISNNYKYSAIATIKAGSSKMTIKLNDYKLVKGRKYKLLTASSAEYGDNLGNWLNETNQKNVKNTFKAK